MNIYARNFDHLFTTKLSLRSILLRAVFNFTYAKKNANENFMDQFRKEQTAGFIKVTPVAITTFIGTSMT